MEYIAFLVMFGPGLALVFWLIADEEFSGFERVLLSLGASLAVYPVLLLFCHVTGIPVSSGLIDTVIVASFILFGWRLYMVAGKRAWQDFWKVAQTDTKQIVAGLFLLIVLVLSAYVRIAVVKDLAVPMWADSYHHTMISQLLIDNQGLFSSWLPYAPLMTFTYHFGFHSIVANYHWLTGINITRAVVVAGQVINFVVVLGSFLLAYRFTGKVWAGNGAALFVGLISPMPAHFFNWGRYPQLTALAVLPAAIILTVHLLNQPRLSPRSIGLTGLVIAGLGLSHYGVLVFFVLFGLIFLGYKVIENRLARPRLKLLSINLLATAAVAALITAPWLWNFVTGRFMTIVTAIVRQAPGAEPAKIEAHNALPNVTMFLNTHWYIVVIIGVIWAVWQREKYTIITSIWAISLLLLANPYFLKLPGTGLINNFAVFISLFLPFSVIFGNLVADLITAAQRWRPWAANIVIIALLLVSIRSAGYRLAFFEPGRQLVTEADLAAMAWIQENTPADALFLINHTFAYSNSTAVGTDAGWWLPLLAGRQNTIPPLSAQETRYPDAFQSNQFYRQVDQVELTDTSGYQLLQEAGITHIYLGQQNGQVWNESGQAPLNAEVLRASSLYREIYHQDNVSVFTLAGNHE